MPDTLPFYIAPTPLCFIDFRMHRLCILKTFDQLCVVPLVI
ncbi:MAG: hypothetical protein JW384_01813 [Nitrosomonadaceae bacterium]|nr:hypothetical protein [Nitrosomonadaceae bacterium]